MYYSTWKGKFYKGWCYSATKVCLFRVVKRMVSNQNALGNEWKPQEVIFLDFSIWRIMTTSSSVSQGTRSEWSHDEGKQQVSTPSYLPFSPSASHSGIEHLNEMHATFDCSSKSLTNGSEWLDSCIPSCCIATPAMSTRRLKPESIRNSRNHGSP